MMKRIPGNLIRKYTNLMRGQSLKVTDLESINGPYYFDVHAEITTDNGEKTTEWVRAIDGEVDHSTYKLFPPRSAGLGIGVASDIKGSWDDLPDDQNAIVDLDYFKGDDSVDRLENKLEEYD